MRDLLTVKFRIKIIYVQFTIINWLIGNDSNNKLINKLSIDSRRLLSLKYSEI